MPVPVDPLPSVSGDAGGACNESRLRGVNVDVAAASFGRDPETCRELSAIGGRARHAAQTRSTYSKRRSPTWCKRSRSETGFACRR